MEKLVDDINNHLEHNSFETLDIILKQCYTDDWKLYVNYDTDSLYKKQIYVNDIIDIYIISFPPLFKTKCHDHSKNGCWLKVLRGHLLETIYTESLEFKETNHIEKDNISFIEDKIGYHDVQNMTNDFCVSLHIYSPPFHKTTYFNL